MMDKSTVVDCPDGSDILLLDKRAQLNIEEIPDPDKCVLTLFGVNLERVEGESQDDTKRRVALALLGSAEKEKR